MSRPGNPKRSWFTAFANGIAEAAGRPLAFALAVAMIVVWGASGPLFGFSDTWQLVINTTTTIVTFLMVFLIQNTQNRDTHAMQIKLDELIRSHKVANNAVLDVEELDEKDLEVMRQHYEKLAHKAVHVMHSRRTDQKRAMNGDGEETAQSRERE